MKRSMRGRLSPLGGHYLFGDSQNRPAMLGLAVIGQRLLHCVGVRLLSVCDCTMKQFPTLSISFIF